MAVSSKRLSLLLAQVCVHSTFHSLAGRGAVNGKRRQRPILVTPGGGSAARGPAALRVPVVGGHDKLLLYQQGCSKPGSHVRRGTLVAESGKGER